jgi:tetratricopeptide (TPR) repeat protein
VLVAQFPERVATEPEVVARHAELAGQIDESITYYHRAGELALAASAYEEAICHLRKAIALLATLPESQDRDAREAGLQLALAGSFAAVRGFGHQECEAAYERACVLCDALSDLGRLGIALIGLAVFYSTRGEVERGRVMATRVLTAAEGNRDEELALYGHIHVAIPEYFQGKFASSLAHCETARPLYAPGRHEAITLLTGDPRVDALGFTAWNLWPLGWPDRALARAREAVVLGRQLGNLFNLAYALCFETVVHWLRRDVAAQRGRAAEMIVLSEPEGFPLWLAFGKMFDAAARATGGEAGAVVDVLAGLALAAEIGSTAGAPMLFGLLCEAQMAAGQLTEAHGAAKTGLALAAQTGQPFYDAELHRLQGEVVLASGDAPADAEVLFHRARDIARAQEAKSFELRAATTLARLWRDQGKRDAARALLAPIYTWFTEGFDTADLKEAKALLEELR